MKVPILDENKCSVLIAEYATGHIFKQDFTLFCKGDNEEEVYQVFDNFYDAEIFVLNLIKNKSEFEYSIYNHFGKYLKHTTLVAHSLNRKESKKEVHNVFLKAIDYQ